MAIFDGRGARIKDEALMYKKAGAMPNNTSAYSDVLDLGPGEGAYSEVPVSLVIDLPAITLASTKTLTITIEDSADGSTYAPVNGIKWEFTDAAALGGRYIVGIWKLKQYSKVKVATTDNLTAKAYSAYLSPAV